jgi:rSAM/selenodomain-associated transferase 1
MTNNLLIIFTRNPELGKCKTRLAAVIGDTAALAIYTFLIEHTVGITKSLKVDKQVHYSQNVHHNDLWNDATYSKKKQQGSDLGERMNYAFKQGFEEGYKNIIIIGSDIYDLIQLDIEKAFTMLEHNNYVLGPAADGGYYLLGMKRLNENIFRNKDWGTDTVLQDTILDLEAETIAMLDIRNDIDIYEDMKDIAIFKKIIEKTI